MRGATRHSHLSVISSKPFDYKHVLLILRVEEDEGYVLGKSSPILEYHLMCQMTIYVLGIWTHCSMWIILAQKCIGYISSST